MTVFLFFGTEIPASDSVHVDPLINSFVTTAYTYEYVSCLFVIEIVSVLARRWVNNGSFLYNEGFLQLAFVPLSDLEEFPLVSVVEPEYSSLG